MSDERAKRFHQVQSERGASETGPVIEAEKGIETDRVTDDREVFGEDAVCE